ncbi:S1 family peptidase [Crossiella sp. NPDC003009]
MRQRLLLLLATTAALLGLTAVPAGAITNGDNARVPTPWMVSLQSAGEHECGGTLVAPQWVLTAFHCVAENGGGDLLRIGGRDRLRGGVVAKPVEVVKHPSAKFDPATGFSGVDLALVRLDRPVSLPPMRLTGDSPGAGTRLDLFGWGLTCSDNPDCTYPDRLQQIALPVAPDAECFRGKDNPKALCLPAKDGKGACSGDSGGPALVRTSRVWRLAGVTSGGGPKDASKPYQCGSPNHFSAYTDVAPEVAWINSVIR